MKNKNSKLNAPFENLKLFNEPPEINLFKAVVIQMLSDLMINSQSKKYLKHKQEAESWFFSDNEDFKIICENANLDPECIRKMALSIFKNNQS